MEPSREDRTDASRRALGALVLLAAVVLTYLPAIQGGFVWDDDYNVTANPTLRSLEGLRRIWSGVTVAPYYPLYHTALWVGYALWGPNPVGYHLLNVVLHALNAVLVWRVLSRLKVPGAWAAAAVFALHPVQVGSVAWITELKNVLSATFYLAAMMAYVSLAGLDAARPLPRSRGRAYALALGLFACALLTKTVTATFPVAVLLLVWWKRGRLSRTDVLPTLPFFALAVGLGSFTAWLEKYTVGASGFQWSHTLLERWLIAGRALWFYAAKLVWPHPVEFVYPRWSIDATSGRAYLFPLAAAAVLVGLWALRERLGRGPLVGALYFTVTLSPALGFFDVFYTRYSFVADRWQYLACVGLIALVVAGATGRALHNRSQRLLGGLVLAAVLVGLGTMSWREARHYEDAETLWRATLSKNPRAFAAHNNLGGMLLAIGDYEQAQGHFRKAIEVQPDFPESHNNLGICLYHQGRYDEAIAHYREALEIWPAYADARNNLGISVAAEGRLEEAAEHFREALRLQESFVNARRNLGVALLHLGSAEEAAEHLRRAVELDPEHVETRLQLGITLARLGRVAEAVEAYAEALRLTPGSTRAALELAWTLATSESDAIRDGAQAVRIVERVSRESAMDDPRSLDVLAAAYAEAGRFEEAERTAAEALVLARSSNLDDLAREIEARRDLYRRGRPFRSPAP